MPDPRYELGTVAAADAVLKDLYLDLRTALYRWSQVTQQTPQPRMGYIGQHLTSVVTGYPGGRSGARGKDLLLPEGRHAEIKTCYRVDQLGKCLDCSQVVASIEAACPLCGSGNIKRNDDSKWLITVRTDQEMRALFDPTSYYLVLFDFADFKNPAEINARIYEVNPKAKGFAYCMVDYYFNIKSKSKSGAPFNLWPFSLKFEIMRARLIYFSLIGADNSIETTIFPGERGEPLPVAPSALTAYSRATGFTAAMVTAVARHFGIRQSAGLKTQGLANLERARREEGWDDFELADVIAEAMYGDRITDYAEWVAGGLL